MRKNALIKALRAIPGNPIVKTAQLDSDTQEEFEANIDKVGLVEGDILLAGWYLSKPDDDYPEVEH